MGRRLPLRRVVLVLLTALGLAALGLAGGGLPLRWRLLVAVVIAAAWEVGMLGAIRLMRRWQGADRFGRSAGSLALAVLVASVPVVAVMMAVLVLVTGRLPNPLLLLAQTLPIALTIGFARRGILRPPADSRTDLPDDVAPPPVPAMTVEFAGRAFLRRHAPQLAEARLLALEAEDHYLRIHTDRGSALVLMRLGDAVVALGDGAGWRVHRSFWLASDAPTRAEPRGQNWQLVLETGRAIPVSRDAARRLGPDLLAVDRRLVSTMAPQSGAATS